MKKTKNKHNKYRGESKQNKALDELIDKCPMFNNYIAEAHNIVIPKNYATTLCEIDDVYVYEDYILIGENKSNDGHACHKKMNTQIHRYKKYQNKILRYLGVDPTLPVYYFYAHFENNKIHIEYEGMK